MRKQIAALAAGILAGTALGAGPALASASAPAVAPSHCLHGVRWRLYTEKGFKDAGKCGPDTIHFTSGRRSYDLHVPVWSYWGPTGVSAEGGGTVTGDGKDRKATAIGNVPDDRNNWQHHDGKLYIACLEFYYTAHPGAYVYLTYDFRGSRGWTQLTKSEVDNPAIGACPAH